MDSRTTDLLVLPRGVWKAGRNGNGAVNERASVRTALKDDKLEARCEFVAVAEEREAFSCSC